MLNIGKVFLPRNIRDHWLWDDANKYKRWNDLVMEATWVRTKFRFGNVKGWLERGQQVTSVRTLMHRWKTSSRYVSDFLADLESENLIKVETFTTHTIITILNYDIYQGDPHDVGGAILETAPAEQMGKRIRQREGSQSKEDNNINNNINSSLLSVEEQNFEFVEQIKSNDLAMEQAVVALRCEKEKVLELLEMFVNDNNFISKRHDDFNDFKSHFINWSRQYLRKEKPNGNGKSKKGGGGNSQDRYANRRGTDAKDHTAEDYDSTF